MRPLPEGRVPQDGVVIAAGTVRGTQSFVHTLSECWRRPSLTALEVLWRWAYGIPALLVLRYEAMRILQEALSEQAAAPESEIPAISPSVKPE